MSDLVGVCVPPDYFLALPTRLCDRPSPLRRLAIRYFDMVGPNWARTSSESMSPERVRALNRTGMSGDSNRWEGWGRGIKYVEEVPARVAGTGGSDGQGDRRAARVGVGGDG